MCKHGDTIDVLVTIHSSVSHNGRSHKAIKPIDRCIAPLICMLEKFGVKMLGSCCGHGESEPSVIVFDNEELIKKIPLELKVYYEKDRASRSILSYDI